MKKLLFGVLIALGFCLPAMAEETGAKDAQWTIHCQSFTGPDRAVEAKAMKERLAASKSPNPKYWHIVHGEGESTLFYGYYLAISTEVVDGDRAQKDAQRAQADMKLIRELKNTELQKLFPMTLFVPVPQPGSDGPPEYDLRKAPADAYWTLYVGVYRDNPERKKAAVEAVKALRAEGKEAYYYHGTSVSLICIGAFPRSAVSEPQEAEQRDNDRDTVVMATNTPMPENTPKEFKDSDGKKVKLYASNYNIVDPTLKTLSELSPYFSTNGVVLGREVTNKKTGKKELVPHKSQLLIIPKADRTAPQRTEQEVIQRLAPVAPASPRGGSGLRRLED